MDGNSSSGGSEAGGDKPVAGPSKSSPALSAATRMQRNKAEKQRRDRLNGYISELATLVPMVANSTKPCDKVSVLRLAASQMRLNISCLNPKKFNGNLTTLPEDVVQHLDYIEKSIGGFIMATTFEGCILWCSKSIEDYVGYQNIDVIGNSLYHYIHLGDASYLGKRVESIIKSHKDSKKRKTKKIRAHMQQRPLPRTNDVRYRKMIFQISVFQNAGPKGAPVVRNESLAPGKHKKSGRTKDFGAKGVVLMFVEPVRLEPEIDITYIESHQDAYFTMHGLQGEIIYADQRISTITGYMPSDVQYTSAYKYICSSDVPIALFAQQAMFSSNDGTGIIVYRLRIADMRYIYLQSSGQIAYKDSSTEISHFVCFNKLLSDELGSQELKKFQQRFAPQIMAAKLKESVKNSDNKVSDEAVEHAIQIMSSMETDAPEDPKTSGNSKKPASSSGNNISKRSRNDSTLPISFPGTSKSAQVAECDSFISNDNMGTGSNNAQANDNGISTSGTTIFAKPRIPEESKSRSILKQNLLMTNHPTLNTTAHSFSNEYAAGNCSAKQKILSQNGSIIKGALLHGDTSDLAKVVNGYLETQQNGVCTPISVQNDNLNTYSVVSTGLAGTDTLQSAGNHQSIITCLPVLHDNIDNNLLPNLSGTQISSGSSSLRTLLLSDMNGQSNVMNYNAQVPCFQTSEDILSPTHNLTIPESTKVVEDLSRNQVIHLNKKHVPQNVDLSDNPSNSSLSQFTDLSSIAADPIDTNVFRQTYPVNGDYVFCNGTFNKVVDVGECSDFSFLKTKSMLDFNQLDSGSYQDLKIDSLNNDVLNSEIVNSNSPTFVNGDIPRFQTTETLTVTEVPYQNKIPDVDGINNTQAVNGYVEPMDWNEQDPIVLPDDLDFNKELYSELNIFFHNYPQQNSSVAQSDDFYQANGSFPSSNISATNKRTHQ